MPPTIKASTPEECKTKIVNFLKEQAHNYHRASMIAERKLVKRDANIKADVCMGMAMFLDGCRIESNEPTGTS